MSAGFYGVLYERFGDALDKPLFRLPGPSGSLTQPDEQSAAGEGVSAASPRRRPCLTQRGEQSPARGSPPTPDSISSDDASGAQVLTYREVDARSAAAAHWLASRGVGVGDRVAVQLDKSIDGVALYLGVLRSDAVYVPLNPAYTSQEVEWLLADAEPRLFVSDPAELADALAQAPSMAAPARFAPARFAMDDPAALVYTSGTTGRPKGAILTHANLATNAVALAQAWHFTPDDVLLHVLPIFHVHGLMVAVHTAMISACEMIFLDRFSVGDVLANLPAATVMMGVPTHFRRLLEHDGFDGDACRNIRLMVSGSAPMTVALHRSVLERTGCEVLERYGMSETLMITSNPYDGPRVPGTVGFALDGVEVRICGPSGEITDPGALQAGVVQVRGPSVGPGYWRRPDASNAARTSDGWFITGDIGRCDSDGRLTLEGRATDLIISGGVNIYPAEIEQALDSCDEIKESAVVGIAHPDFGEAVVAFVVPADGAERRDLQAQLADCVEGLARFKHPKRYVFVKELPRNAMGKILKSELRARHTDSFAAVQL